MKNLLLFFLLITNISFSQNYTTAIGIKGGYPGFGTLNAKHFIGIKQPSRQVSAVFKTNYGTGAFVMLDYELNSELDPGFSWYYGGGALVGFTRHQKIVLFYIQELMDFRNRIYF